MPAKQALQATGTKLTDYWPVFYHSLAKSSKPGRNRHQDIHSGTTEFGPTNLNKAEHNSPGNTGKRKRSVDVTELHSLKAPRSCREGTKRRAQPSNTSFTAVPTELVSNVLDFCSLDDILSLGQVSHRFRRICSNPYLCRLGIITKSGNGAAHIRLVGRPFSPSAVAFLREVDLGFPRISLTCDLFHASSFSSEIIRFLVNHSIQGLEMVFLEDEVDILEDLSFPVIFHSILSAIPSTCERVSFNAHGMQILRTLPPPYRTTTTTSPSRSTRHLKFWKPLESVTEFRLSSVFSRTGALWGIISRLLQVSAIELVSLDCDTSEDPWIIIQSMAVPCLEMLSIITHGNTLPLFPNSFHTVYPKLTFLSILNLRSWDTPDSPQEPLVHLSLPALSHLTVSSNYSSFDIQDITGLSRLNIIPFKSTPIPEKRGYCEVVESLTRALRLSTSSQHFSASLMVSFTFPCFLDDHLRFCQENATYSCSCSSPSMIGRLVKDVRNIEIRADVLSDTFMGYVRTWTRQFPQLINLNIVTDRYSVADQLPQLSSFRLYCEELLEVTFTCGGEELQFLK